MDFDKFQSAHIWSMMGMLQTGTHAYFKVLVQDSVTLITVMHWNSADVAEEGLAMQGSYYIQQAELNLIIWLSTLQIQEDSMYYRLFCNANREIL